MIFSEKSFWTLKLPWNMNKKKSNPDIDFDLSKTHLKRFLNDILILSVFEKRFQQI
jgi:hypothetical protein